VAEQQGPLSVERCIVDSGSTDGTVEAARQYDFEVLTVDARDFNHGATRDHAIERTKGRAIALVVQDAIPADDRWLHELAAPLLEDEEAAGSFSRQVSIPGGNPILDERLRGWIAGKDEARRSQLERPEQWDELDPIARLHQVAFDNVASCVKRQRWQEHPFGHRPFGEDLGWSTWAIRAGHAIRFEPRSVVEHSHDRSAWYEARRIYCDHRNLNQLLGLCSFPTLRDALRARPHAAAHYLDILERSGLEGEELRRRQKWARQYALGETVAQWLAPRVNRAQARGFWGWLDRRLRRGI